MIGLGLLWRKPLLLVATLTGLLSAQEDYATWPHSQKLTINTTASGANVAQNVTNFPLLLRLNAASFAGFTSIAPGGADVRFAKSDGAHVAYEIERWVGDSAEVWIKLDTVYGNDDSHSIVMYWGKSGAAAQSNSGAVFDTGNGFQGVWHFNEASGAPAKDATINKYDGAPVGTTKPGDALGPIGRAKSYDGKVTGYDMTGTAAGKLNFPENSAYTVSGWAYLSVTPKAGTYYNICNKSDVQYNLVCNEVGKWEMTQFSQVKRYDRTGLGYATKAAVSTWVYVLGIRNGAKQYLYLNGVCVDSTIASKTESFPYSQTFDAGVGKQSNGTDVFDGLIDEVRFENVARGKDWIKLSYETQKPNANAVAFSGASAVGSQYALLPRAHARRVKTTVEAARIRLPGDAEGDAAAFDALGKQAASAISVWGWKALTASP